MEKRPWVVVCEISGTCNVYVEATSEEEAMRLANKGEWEDCEIHEWKVEDAQSAELNE